MKRQYALILLCLAVPLVCAAAENAIRNGDFQKRKNGWKTDAGMDAVEVASDPLLTADMAEKNLALEVELHGTRSRTLSQRIALKKTTKALRISFRIKASTDYESAAPSAGSYVSHATRDDGGGSYQTQTIGTVDEWTSETWLFTELRSTRGVTFSVEFKPGTGKLWIDDVVVEELDR